MRTIYAVILASGLYTDGQITSTSPLPVPQVECLSIALKQEPAADCVRLPWPVETDDPEMLLETGGALDE